MVGVVGRGKGKGRGGNEGRGREGGEGRGRGRGRGGDREGFFLQNFVGASPPGYPDLKKS